MPVMLQIIYDANCTICTQIKEYLSKLDLDSNYSFQKIQDSQIYLEHPQLNYWDCRKTIHVMDKDGRLYTSEMAVIKILEQLRYLKSISPTLKSPMSLKLIGLLYQLINSYRLNQQKNCDICRT